MSEERAVRMSWTRASADDLRVIAEFFAALTWPVPEERAMDVFAQLGWRPVAAQTFLTGLPVKPDLARYVVASGEAVEVIVNLSSRSDDTSEERDAFQHAAFAEFSEVLQEVLGPWRPLPFPRSFDAVYWVLDSGARVTLKTDLTRSTLEVWSPVYARAMAVNQANPDLG